MKFLFITILSLQIPMAIASDFDSKPPPKHYVAYFETSTYLSCINSNYSTVSGMAVEDYCLSQLKNDLIKNYNRDPASDDAEGVNSSQKNTYFGEWMNPLFGNSSQEDEDLY